MMDDLDGKAHIAYGLFDLVIMILIGCIAGSWAGAYTRPLLSST